MGEHDRWAEAMLFLDHLASLPAEADSSAMPAQLDDPQHAAAIDSNHLSGNGSRCQNRVVESGVSVASPNEFFGSLRQPPLHCLLSVAGVSAGQFWCAGKGGRPVSRMGVAASGGRFQGKIE